MSRMYFISFDYWGKGYNKFFSTLVNVDITTENIQSVAIRLIRAEHTNINMEEVTIKLLAFNNITSTNISN